MDIKASDVKKLREITSVSMMECKKALEESDGDIKEAVNILRKRGEHVASQKAERLAKEGLIESYVHPNGKVGVLLQLLSETDFVAKSREFKELAHDLTLHIAAMNPLYLSEKDIPEDVIKAEIDIYNQQNPDKPKDILEKIVNGKLKKFAQEKSLLSQPFIKDDTKTIEDLINEIIGRIGENIKIGRFVRFEI